MSTEAVSQAQAAKIALGQEVLAKVMDFVVKYFFQILGAAVVLALGWWAAGKVGNFVTRFCEKKNLDVLLARFIGSGVRFALIAFIVLAALDLVGISVTPLVAIVGAGTLGISLALQGPISNYGAGLIIILTRPFTLGDLIRVGEYSGVVEEVKLGFTRLHTEDGEIITIPNKQIVGEVQTNSKGNRVVESVVGVDYAADMDRAVEAVRAAVWSVPEVVREPVPQVGIDNFGDSAVVIGYRYWVPSRNYFNTRYAVNRAVFAALNRAGVALPFPQRVVHLKTGNPGREPLSL
ncbi:MAG: mechanosensitive ion channel [Candidatus Methylacidiphilales bacterium]|nr:mechanosensitive ion channel [Candidatus Methylacidiphilales bacterium]